MRQLLKYIYRNLLPVRLRQSIDIFQYLRLPEVEGLNEKKVLILSPHPDDEIIGCGETIHNYPTSRVIGN
jgi:hypothetical protein